MKGMKKTKSLVIRLTAEEHKNLRVEALERNISAAALIRQAVALYIKTYTVK